VAHLAASIQLVSSAFPEIFADAERFVTETHAEPWEFSVAFISGELRTIQERYEVHHARHRPASQDVSPETDMFYEACELVAKREGLLD
jgi:hypothetical protein